MRQRTIGSRPEGESIGRSVMEGVSWGLGNAAFVFRRSAFPNPAGRLSKHRHSFGAGTIRAAGFLRSAAMSVAKRKGPARNPSRVPLARCRSEYNEVEHVDQAIRSRLLDPSEGRDASDAFCGRSEP